MMQITRRKAPTTIGSLSKGMAYIIFILPFFFGLLLELLGLPAVVKFAVDAMWIGLIGFSLMQQKLSIRRELLPLAVIVMIFVGYTFLVYLFRFQSPFYYLWGLRNYLRFYIAFFAFANLFTEDDARKCLKFMDFLFWINAALCVIQFMSGYEQDNIGGIFGVTKGCNAYLVIYFSVVIAKTVLSYMNGKEKTIPCFVRCAVTLFVSAIAELKFFYLVFVVIMVMAMVLTRFSAKKVLFLMVSVMIISVAAAVLGMLYSNFAGFLSFDSLVEAFMMESYANDVDMGRTNAIQFISSRFLTSTTDQLFGLGLGNCDTGSIAEVNTEFYLQHADLHYSIFSYAFMFLENGYIGLFLYVAFFAVCVIEARKILKNKKGDPLFCQMGLILTVLCFAMIIYNSSLRIEAGYMMFFGLALPFISAKKSPQAAEMMDNKE